MTPKDSPTLAAAAKFRAVRQRQKDAAKAAHEQNKDKKKETGKARIGIFNAGKYKTWI